MGVWIIDGNIGCGKTTLLNYIETTYKNTIVIREPLDDWQPLLEKFYNNPKEFSYQFQEYILNYHISLKHKINKYLANNIYKNIFIERSFLSCLYVFGKELVNEGNLTQEQQDLLIENYRINGWSPDGFVYLECTPEICYERIHIRNRNSEELISMDYLTKINNHYNDVYSNINNIEILKLTNVIVKKIDSTQNSLIVNKLFDSLFTS